LAAGHEKHKAIATILHRSTEEEYLAHVRVSPLVSVRGGAHLAKSLNVIDRQIDETERAVADEAYLSALRDSLRPMTSHVWSIHHRRKSTR
jgi:hypothetical protein